MLSFYYALFGDAPSEQIEDTFFMMSLIALFLPLAFSAVYYLVINRQTASFCKLWHWGLFLALQAIIVALSGYSLSSAADNAELAYAATFALANGIFATILYVLSSFLFKRGSTYAPHVPF
jgi:hypothetical protein